MTKNVNEHTKAQLPASQRSWVRIPFTTVALISHLLKFCITAMTFHVFTNILLLLAVVSTIIWFYKQHHLRLLNTVRCTIVTVRSTRQKKRLQIVRRFLIFYFWQDALAVRLAVITTMHNNHVRKVMWERIASN